MEFDREVFDLMPSGNKTFNLIGLKMPSDKDIQPVEKGHLRVAFSGKMV